MMSRQFSRKLHLLLPFCRRMKLLWWCPWFKNDFGFLFAKKLVAQKNLLVEWSPPSDFFTYFTDILSGIHIWSHIFSDILSGSGILSGISILGDSSWLRSGGEHFDTEVAVGVRRGTLWSGACGGDPAGNTLVRSLAVEVRRGTLWSRGCCWGRGTLWSWACCSGPAGKTAI